MQVSSSWPPVACVRPETTAELESRGPEDKGWNESMPHVQSLSSTGERQIVKELCKIISDNTCFGGNKIEQSDVRGAGEGGLPQVLQIGAVRERPSQPRPKCRAEPGFPGTGRRAFQAKGVAGRDQRHARNRKGSQGGRPVSREESE